MKLNQINAWWRRGMEKERTRLTHTAKFSKKERFATVTKVASTASKEQPAHAR